jgi:hypothetical protein
MWYIIANRRTKTGMKNKNAQKFLVVTMCRKDYEDYDENNPIRMSSPYGKHRHTPEVISHHFELWNLRKSCEPINKPYNIIFNDIG